MVQIADGIDKQVRALSSFPSLYVSLEGSTSYISLPDWREKREHGVDYSYRSQSPGLEMCPPRDRLSRCIVLASWPMAKSFGGVWWWVRRERRERKKERERERNRKRERVCVRLRVKRKKRANNNTIMQSIITDHHIPLSNFITSVRKILARSPSLFKSVLAKSSQVRLYTLDQLRPTFDTNTKSKNLHICIT